MCRLCPSVVSICFGPIWFWSDIRFSRTRSAILAGAELLEPIDDPMRVADRGDVRIRDEIDRVGGEHRDVGDGSGHGSRVDDDEVVRAAEHAAAAARRPARRAAPGRSI